MPCAKSPMMFEILPRPPKSTSTTASTINRCQILKLPMTAPLPDPYSGRTIANPPCPCNQSLGCRHTEIFGVYEGFKRLDAPAPEGKTRIPQICQRRAATGAYRL